jgi:hypothetical protein
MDSKPTVAVKTGCRTPVYASVSGGRKILFVHVACTTELQSG